MGKAFGYWVTVLALTVAAVVAAASVAYFTGDLNKLICSGQCSEEFISSPLEESGFVQEPAVVLGEITGPLDPQKISQIVTAGLDSTKLGNDVAITIRDYQTGDVLLQEDDKPQVPASSIKILTATAALETFGTEFRFETKLVKESDGTYILVGGGDPLLTKKSLNALAEQASEQMKEQTISLGYDNSLFIGPTLHPDWTDSYFASGASAHILPLRVHPPFRKPDSQDPTSDAMNMFAQALEERGVTVNLVGERKAASTAVQIAEKQSPRMATIVERVVRFSDNYATEVLGRHLALAKNQPASFAGAVAATTEVASELQIDDSSLKLYDVSGLSPRNNVRPATIVELLSESAKDEDRWVVYQGLPVSGVIGTLDRRFGIAQTKPGRGFVRAKTGTLNGVTSLSGLVVTADGGAAYFSVMADGVPSGQGWNAEIVLDKIFANIAACACRLGTTP